MKLVERPVYTVKFRAEPGADPIHALRALLKAALRRYRLRCIDVREQFTTDEATERTLK